MKIISTAIMLMVSLTVVSLVAFYFLNDDAWQLLKTLLYIMAGVALYSFIVAELTNNHSQVDKLWSLVPIVYVWVVAVQSGMNNRLLLMAILVTLWGMRLTANFALKGAYQLRFWAGEEDYRWKMLKAKEEFTPRWKFTLFNLFFIAGYQHVLILLFTLPAVVAFQHTDEPLGWLDAVAALFMLFFLVYETIADIQQWRYQSAKWRMINNGEALTGDYAKGFLDKGLWAYSRHPNYLGEQGVWLSFYLFSVAASGQWLNWSIMGALLLLVLFNASSRFSEEISAGKYAAYKHYQQSVPRFIPWKKGRKA